MIMSTSRGRNTTGKSRNEPRSGPGGADILSFFKPVARLPPQSSTPTRSASQPPVNSPPPSLPSPPPPPPPPSSPPGLTSTPPETIRTEICASDDDSSDGDYSDESLKDLSCLLGHTRNAAPAPQKSPHNPYATPRAKRTAITFHSSPLAPIPRHKFDLKALAKDARCDDATTASSLRVKQTIIAAKERKETPSNSSATGDTIAGIVREKGGQDQDAQKVLRAVQRSEQSQCQNRYMFFEETYKPSALPRAPTLPRNSPWNLLTQGSAKTREQHLTSGVPQTILRKNGGLPDSLFEWMLDSLCLQPSIIARQEYCNMIASCPEHIDRLLTAERVRQLFILLGARNLDRSTSDQSVSNMEHEPYEDRDWSCLQSFISLLGFTAGHLSINAAMYATQTLIQLALDKFLICNAEVLSVFQYAILELTAAIPTLSWDTFCFETSAFLGGIKTRDIKTTALLCIPIGSKRTHDLRRRIAVSTLLQDDALARHNSEDIVNLRTIIECLRGESFAIRPTTDFAELRASIILLDIAVDDGSIVHFDDRDDENKFNEEIDELAGKLREIWRKTNDAGMRLARTEAKSVVEWVQQRLLHSVRTRKEARKSVFDLPGQRDDPFLPRQRDYMHKFLQRKPKSPAAPAATATAAAEQCADEADVPDEAEEGGEENEWPHAFKIDDDTIVVAGG